MRWVTQKHTEKEERVMETDITVLIKKTKPKPATGHAEPLNSSEEISQDGGRQCDHSLSNRL